MSISNGTLRQMLTQPASAARSARVACAADAGSRGSRGARRAAARAMWIVPIILCALGLIVSVLPYLAESDAE
jgi:hypothetical protein